MAVLSAAMTSDYSQTMVTALRQPESEEGSRIERAKRGDQRSFEQLYRSNVDRVYALCIRMTGNVAEAEDCVQEAFIQAWKQLPKFRGDSAFATWMHRIAVNAVLGRMRKSKREQLRLEVVKEQSEQVPKYSDTGDLRDLAQTIEKLPEGARHVFVLHAVYGYSHEEAADMLGIAIGTSKAQVHRARRLLAQQLDEDGFTE